MHGPKKLEVTIALSGFLFTFFFCVALVKRTSYAAFLVKMSEKICYWTVELISHVTC